GRAREDFQKNVQATLMSLGIDRERGRGKCPADALAPAYARAYRAAKAYHRLGRELEANAAAIRDLDELGETRGLTPDYRWKVARALKLYREVLRDFQEMRVAFQVDLAAELKYRGCDPEALAARGEELMRTAEVAAATAPVPGAAPRPTPAPGAAKSAAVPP